MSLFPGKYGSVTLGAIVLLETFSFFAFGVINSLIFSADSFNTFLTLFLTLAGAVPTSALVSPSKKSLVVLAGANLAVPVTNTVAQDQPEQPTSKKEIYENGTFI